MGWSRRLAPLLITCVGVAPLALVPSSAVAVGFFVNSIADDVDLAPGNGVCATGTGACTLRAAIQEANVLSGVHSIFLPSGTYTLTIPGGSEDFAATGDLDIRASMTITGAGAIIDGGGLDRVLHVIAGSVNISGVTIRNGRSPGFGGGGIRNDATLRLSNSVLSGNSGSGNGGGLRNAGSATLTNVTVSGNASGSNGAGIFNEGTLSVTDGTIRDNVSGGVSGEGFWNNGGTATLSRVTVSGNGSTGILNSAALTLVNVTISGNAREGLRNDSFFGSTGSATLTNVTVTGNGGAANVVVTQGTVTLKNTLLAGPGPNCSGPVASQGHNLDSGNTCGLAGSGDLVNTNPMLGPLAANTGFTLTHALLPGSPAIDAGDDAGCPATDQRGIRRPVDGDGNTLRVCDIGAYEQATAFKVFIVTTTADGVDASPLDGVCATATGVCTLRAAIQQANAVTGATPAITIVLPAGTYVLTIPGAAEDAAATGDLDITQTVLITGAEAATTIVAGGGLDRVFEIHPAGLPVQIEQVTVRGGSADSGGGIYVQTGAGLILEDAVVSGNTAYEGGGVGSGVAGVTIRRSTISGNTAMGFGGGVENLGTLEVVDSTISGNTAVFSGGGIFYAVDAILGDRLRLTNVTLSGNQAGTSGGGLRQEFGANGTLTNVTVTGNTAPKGAGLFNDVTSGSVLTLTNTIVAGNVGGNCASDVTGLNVTSAGHNLDSGTTCAFTGPGDLVNRNPLLGPLAANGGPTRTHPLLAGSPAIDAGDDSGCPVTDQRGIVRPVDGTGDGVATCDIGAYEARLFLVTVTRAGSGTGRILSAPPGIDCGGDCTQRYVERTTVTLSASPASDSTFEGWSVACTGVGACTLTVTATTAVTATFKRVVVSLVVRGVDSGIYHNRFIGTGWVGFAALPGSTADAPALVAGGGTLDLVVRGVDNSIYHNHYAGGAWAGWTQLPGAAADAPALVASGGGALDLVVRGIDSSIYHNHYTGSAWAGWTQLPGAAADVPALVSSGGGRLDLVIRGIDNSIYHNHYTGSAWTGWTQLPGAVADAPALVASGGGALDLVVRGIDSSIYHNHYTGSAWTGWIQLPGAAADAPALVASGSGVLNLVVRGTDGSVHHNRFTGAAWLGWTTLPGATTDAPALVARTGGALELAVRGTDNGVYHNRFNGTSWLGWIAVGGSTASRPALAVE